MIPFCVLEVERHDDGEDCVRSGTLCQPVALCHLLDSLFMLVAATVLDLFPSGHLGVARDHSAAHLSSGLQSPGRPAHTAVTDRPHRAPARCAPAPGHTNCCTQPRDHLQSGLVVARQVEQVEHTLVVDLHVADLEALPCDASLLPHLRLHRLLVLLYPAKQRAAQTGDEAGVLWRPCHRVRLPWNSVRGVLSLKLT